MCTTSLATTVLLNFSHGIGFLGMIINYLLAAASPVYLQECHRLIFLNLPKKNLKCLNQQSKNELEHHHVEPTFGPEDSIQMSFAESLDKQHM